MNELELYRFAGSPNCERVEMALRHQRRPCRLIEIDRDGDRGEVVAISGQHLVPVLVDGSKVVPDSTEILEYLDTLDGEPPLFPRDTPSAAAARVLLGWFNAVWKRPMNRILDAYSSDAPDAVSIDRELACLDRYNGLIDAWLENRVFLATNDGPSAADFGFYPFLKHTRRRYPPLYESWNRFATSILGRSNLPRLERWLERVAEWE